ncbi:hypothetical protein EI555_017843, partial [Monodon monoceros]
DETLMWLLFHAKSFQFHELLEWHQYFLEKVHMGRFPLPPILTPHQRSLDTPPSVLPRHGARLSQPPKVLRARKAEPRACTAQVLCQPICRFRAVYGLESHMALEPAGAFTLLLSSEQDENPKSTHLHEEQHDFLRSAQSGPGSSPAVSRCGLTRPVPPPLKQQLFPALENNCFREKRKSSARSTFALPFPAADLNMQLGDIMQNVQWIINCYTMEENRASLLEKIVTCAKTAEIKEKTLVYILAWLEEWNVILPEMTTIDIDEHHHCIAQTEMLPETLKAIESNVKLLSRISTPLKKRRNKRKKQRPATAHALRPDQTISDQFATNTKVSEIQDMLQELKDTAVFNKLENNAIKYMSSTIENLSKALSTLNDEVKVINLQSANMYTNATSEREKEISLKIIQDLSKKNEMLQQKLQEAEEKYKHLVRSKGVEHQALPTSTLRVLPEPSPQLAISQADTLDSVDNILAKEFEIVVDEAPQKGTKALGIKWDSSPSYTAQGETISDITDQQYPLPEKKQKKSSEEITEDIIIDKISAKKGGAFQKDGTDQYQSQKGKRTKGPYVQETSESNVNDDKGKQKVAGPKLDHHFEIQALEKKRKEIKSFSESKSKSLTESKGQHFPSDFPSDTKSQGGKSGTSSIWERLRKAKPEYSHSKSQISSENKEELIIESMDEEGRKEKTEEKDMSVFAKKVKSLELVKSQSRITKETSGTPDGKREQSNLEEFQKAIVSFLKEKIDNIGKPLDKKTRSKEELLLKRAEVEKLGIIKTKIEEYFQKVAETVTKILRKYKDIKNAGQIGEKPMKRKKVVSFMPELHFQKQISAKSEISTLLSQESLGPLTDNLIQMILAEIESERDVPVASTVGKDHKEKEKQRLEERSYEMINKNLEKEEAWLPMKEGKRGQQKQKQWQEEEVWKGQQKQRMQKQIEPDERQKKREEEKEGHQKSKQQQLEAWKQKMKEQGVPLEKEKGQQVMQVQKEVRYLEQESSPEREEEKQKPRRKVEDHERQKQKTAKEMKTSEQPEQVQELGENPTPKMSQGLGAAHAPEQAHALRVTLTPQQVQALGITLTHEQAQTLGIHVTPEQAQAQVVPHVTAQQTQELGITLTPQQAQGLGIHVTPQQAQDLGAPFTLGQAQALGVSLSPEQFEELGVPPTSDNNYTLESPHIPEQIQPLGAHFTPGQAQSMGITLRSEQDLKLGALLINEQSLPRRPGPPSRHTLEVGVFSVTDIAVTTRAPHIPKQSPVPSAPVAEKSPLSEVSSTPSQISRSPLTQAPFVPGKSLGMRIPSEPRKLLAPQTFPSSRQTPVSKGQSTSLQSPAQYLGPLPLQGSPLHQALLSSRQFFISRDIVTPQLPLILKPLLDLRQLLISGVPATSAQIPSSICHHGPFLGKLAHYGSLPPLGNALHYGLPQPLESPRKICPLLSLKKHWSIPVLQVSRYLKPLSPLRSSKYQRSLTLMKKSRDPRDPFAMEQFRTFKSYLTDYRTPVSQTPYIDEGALPTLIKPSSPSEWDQKSRFPPIDKTWILTSLSGTQKTKMMVPTSYPQELKEQNYFVDVEAQQKNLILLNQATKASILPSQLHTTARNLIIETLHTDKVRLGYLFHKYIAYRLIQCARNNIIKWLQAIQNTGRGYETQNLYIMLSRIDDYQKKVMQICTGKQKSLQQKQNQCLRKMTYLFSQIICFLFPLPSLQEIYKLNLNQPIPLIIKKKQTSASTKFVQQPILKEEDKKYDIFNKFRQEDQMEAIWNADLSTSSYPITEKTSMYSLWAQLGGYPDIPMLLQLDVHSTFRRSLACIQPNTRELPKVVFWCEVRLTPAIK